MSMDEKSILDRSGNFKCPYCSGDQRLHYNEIPECSRNYVYMDPDNGRTEMSEYFPPTRDYHCLDCDTEWTLTAWDLQA